MNAKYTKYLSSPQWKSIRALVIARDKGKCMTCNSKVRLCVHHKCYDNLYHELKNLDDLITLCDKCHSKLHGKRAAKSKRKRASGKIKVTIGKYTYYV